MDSSFNFSLPKKHQYFLSTGMPNFYFIWEQTLFILSIGGWEYVNAIRKEGVNRFTKHGRFP